MKFFAKQSFLERASLTSKSQKEEIGDPLAMLPMQNGAPEANILHVYNTGKYPSNPFYLRPLSDMVGSTGSCGYTEQRMRPRMVKCYVTLFCKLQQGQRSSTLGRSNIAAVPGRRDKVGS